jgi:hypothetical protein
MNAGEHEVLLDEFARLNLGSCAVALMRCADRCFASPRSLRQLSPEDDF